MRETVKVTGNAPDEMQRILSGDVPGGDASVVSLLSAFGTPFGFGLDPAMATSAIRSDQVVREAIQDPVGIASLIGYVELSGGPAYGREVLTSVAWGWAIASIVAVLLAAVAGWLMSRRLIDPLLELTDATRHIAGGDLSARAEVRRQDELGVLAVAFNDMAGQVDGTVSTLRRFVADAAHELHTPLTDLEYKS